jgi:hypothetical protein
LAGRLAAARETAPQDRRREQVHELIVARPSVSRAAWMISRGQSRAPRAGTPGPRSPRQGCGACRYLHGPMPTALGLAGSCRG